MSDKPDIDMLAELKKGLGPDWVDPVLSKASAREDFVLSRMKERLEAAKARLRELEATLQQRI